MRSQVKRNTKPSHLLVFNTDVVSTAHPKEVGSTVVVVTASNAAFSVLKKGLRSEADVE
jgi:hypothetical protein